MQKNNNSFLIEINMFTKKGHKQDVPHRSEERIFFFPKKILAGMLLETLVVILYCYNNICLHVCVYIHVHTWFQKLFLSQEIRDLLVSVTLGLGGCWFFYFIEQHRKDAYLLMSFTYGYSVWCMYCFNIVKCI